MRVRGRAATTLRTQTLSSANDFARLSEQISELRTVAPAEESLYTDPNYILACTDSVRRSCSVACWRDDELLGVLFALSHYAFGVPVGYAVSGDYSGRGTVLSRPEHRTLVATAGVDHLLRKGIHSLHLRASPPIELQSISGIAVRNVREIVPGDRLVLGATYEAFLASLGKHTRRNIRHYTRLAAAAGLVLAPDISAVEYADAVRRLSLRTSFPIVDRRLARDQRLAAIYHGEQFGLRNRQGEIVAALCGFPHQRCFHILSQVNGVGFAELSLSLVLRGLTIAHLIAAGYTELQFMGGTSLPLGRFCASLDYQSSFLDRPHLFFTPLKKLAGGIVNLAATRGRSVPNGLEMLAGGFLPPNRIPGFTPLLPAAALRQKAVRHALHESPESDPFGEPSSTRRS